MEPALLTRVRVRVRRNGNKDLSAGRYIRGSSEASSSLFSGVSFEHTTAPGTSYAHAAAG